LGLALLIHRPIPGSAAGTFTGAAADAVADVTWSAMRDPATGCGIAVSVLDPGKAGRTANSKLSLWSGPVPAVPALIPI
jgi:hypothetical protein